MVIIILALVAIGGSTKPIDQAANVNFQQQLSDVIKGVQVKKLANSKLGTDEETLNKGFIKVNVNAEGVPASFVSYDEDSITGYVVDLSAIEYEKLTFGRDYLDLHTGDTISFNNDDVFVYDAKGTIYYAKGNISASGDTYYTEEKNERVDGPKIEILENVNGTIKIKVTPANSGEISSVTVGKEEAETSDGTIFLARVTSNGSYVILAKEDGGGTARAVIKVIDVAESGEGMPIVKNVLINDGNEYTNHTTVNLHIDADNAERIAVRSSLVQPRPTDSVWEEYTIPTSVRLTREGKNTFYIWAKNRAGIVSQFKAVEITRDTISPSTTGPSYEIHGFSMNITGRQADTTELTYEYAYRKRGTATWEWQSNSVVNNLEPGAVYEIKTKARDKVGNESESTVVTTSSVPTVPNDITITVTPSVWSKSKEVFIQYPDTYGVGKLKNVYRINDEEWKEVKSNNINVRVTEDAEIYAAVKLDDVNEYMGAEVSKSIRLDKTGPTISNVTTEKSGDIMMIKAKVQDSRSGFVAYAITDSENTPAYWPNIIEKTTELEEISFEITENKKYYIWVKDALDNVSGEVIIVDNIDKTDPVIKSCNVNYEAGKAIINATMQDLDLGLVAYAVVKGDGTVPEESDWVNVDLTQREYVMSYTIEGRSEDDNGHYTIWAKDKSGRTTSVVRTVKVWFTVTYDYETNGGTSINISSNIKKQGCLTNVDLTPRARKENSEFIGWNINPNATEALTTYTIGTVEDVRLYAIFKKKVKAKLVYYSGETKQSGEIEASTTDESGIVKVSIPNISNTYKDWTACGWSNKTENDAAVLYSGENVEIETDKNVTLYMMYKKNVSATYRYYDYKTEETNTDENAYLYVEKVADNSYNKYFSASQFVNGEIRANASNITNTTSFTSTIPTVKTSVKYGGNNAWSLRGWSKDSASDAVREYSSGQTVNLLGNEIYYASYETTVNANKYYYGSTTPEAVTGKATMNYNANTKPAVISLNTAPDVEFKSDTWKAAGWSKDSNIDSEIVVANDGNANITNDTNFYAKYERDVKIVTNKYGMTEDNMTAQAMLSQDGTTKKARFVLNDISNATLGGKTWSARGYALTDEPNASIVATSGTIIETDEDIEYFASYYNNIKTIKQLLNSRKVLAGTVYLGYDGIKKGNTLNLGSFEVASYDNVEWNPLCWSTDTTADGTNTFSLNGEVEAVEDKTYYAIYNKGIEITKYAYGKPEGKTTATAKLNANGTIKNAVINLGEENSANAYGSTWSHTEWITTSDIEDESAVTYAKNGNVELHKNMNFYAVYGNNFDVKAYYLNESAEPKEQTFSSQAKLAYNGKVINTNETILPSLYSVQKDSATWAPKGYLRRSDGYTIADANGEVVENITSPIKINSGDEFYAIYETDIEITKVKSTGNEILNEKLPMNARAEIAPIAVSLGSIESITSENATWKGNGWNIVNEGTATPAVAMDGTVDVTGNATYYASYTRDLNVEFQEFSSAGVTASTYKKVPVYMNAAMVIAPGEVQVQAPKSNNVTIDGETWNFEKWAHSTDIVNNTEFENAGNNMSLNEDLTLYAQYKRNVTVNVYKYENELASTLTGAATMNTLGTKKGAEITFPTVENVVNSVEWTCRGFSTGTGATAGADFVGQNENKEIDKDSTYYASYTTDIIADFVGYDGSSQQTVRKQAKGYMNYLGAKEASPIIVPTNIEYPSWKFAGYTEATESTATPTYTSRIITLLENKTIYALYEKEITLTYDANGGTPTPLPQTIKETINAHAPTVINTPIINITTDEVFKEGCEFTGEWNTAEDGHGVGYRGNEQINITEDTTLYAKYEKIIYNINYNLNGGEGSITSPQQKVIGGTITSVIPTRDGYEFLGWGISADSTTVVYRAGDAYAPEGNEDLYAIWKAE